MTLLISGVIFTLGTVVWAYTKIKPSLNTLFVAQLLLGIGSGSMGTARTYVIEQTEEGLERTDCLANVLSWKFIGLAVTPFLGSLAVIIGGVVFHRKRDYTFPAFLLFFLGISWIVLLIYPFKNVEETETGRRLIRESHWKEEEQQQKNQERSSHQRDEESSLLSGEGHPTKSKSYESIDRQATRSQIDLRKGTEIDHTGITSDLVRVFIIVILLNCLVKGAIAVYETHISRLMIEYYGWDQYHVGMMVSVSGIIGALQLINFHSIFTTHWSSYELMYASAMAIIGIHILLLVTNFTILLSPIHIASQQRQANSIEEIVLMLSILVIYGFGYPIASTAAAAKYSNLLEYGRQGVIQAVMSLYSSITRIIASIASSYVAHYRSIYYYKEDDYYNLHNQPLVGMILLLMTGFLFLLIVFREQILVYGPDRVKMRADQNKEINNHINRGVGIVTLTIFIVSLYTMFY